MTETETPKRRLMIELTAENKVVVVSEHLFPHEEVSLIVSAYRFVMLRVDGDWLKWLEREETSRVEAQMTNSVKEAAS